MSHRLIFGYTVLAIVGLALLAFTIVAIKLVTQDTPSVTPTPVTDRSHYVVKEGDALAAISQETGVTVERLMQLNPTVDPLALEPGRRIRLKPRPPAKAGSRPPGSRRPRKRVYVVRQGDGLLSIQEKTGVPVERIRSLNRGIESKQLVPGQRVRLRR